VTSVRAISASGALLTRRGGAPLRDGDAPSRSQALVRIAPIEMAERPSSSCSRMPAATFIAHLIAIRDRAPQTRQRRRAEPADAADAYATVMRRKALTGRKMSLST
jgi:hypothetical protein